MYDVSFKILNTRGVLQEICITYIIVILSLSLSKNVKLLYWLFIYNNIK